MQSAQRFGALFEDNEMNRSSPPRVSIVTPVHNGAEYLSECIESVLSQSYQNWDYTIVDNCSTDNSVEIAERYIAGDSRIRIHRNPQFLGAIPSHNAALRLISPSSKYCKVVFADDWIFPECLERMVAVAEEFPTTGIIGAYVLEEQNVICSGLPYQSTFVTGREICRQHLLNKLYVLGSANSLLFRSELIRSRDPFLNESNIHADTEACFALLDSCDFGFVHQVLTFTRVRAGSLTAASNDMQTSFSGTLQILMEHGRNYLACEELEVLLRDHLAGYYRFLGKSLLRGQRETLRYHKGALAKTKYGFSWLRVVLGGLSTLLALALNPKSTTEKLLKGGDSPGTAEHRYLSKQAAAVDKGDTIG